MTQQTNDITTRLLAQENLLIQRAPVSTASFDVVNRILTLPQWQNMTPEIEDMLKAHEVGHALYTDFDTFEAAQEAVGEVHKGYLNVLEDVRIEKMMKRKYPGLRRAFTEGYNQLNERDFFELSKQDISQLQLIDRINIYFKVGLRSGVKFTQAEQYLVDQANRLDTIQDVVGLAHKVYDFTKRQQEEQAKRFSGLRGSDSFMAMEEEQAKADAEDEVLYTGNSSYDLDDEENRHEYEIDEDELAQEREERKERIGQTGAGSSDKLKEETDVDHAPRAPITVRSFEKKLAEAADVSTRYTYIDMVRMASLAGDIIIPYKTVLADNANAVQQKLEQWKDRNTYYSEMFVSRAAKVAPEYEKFIQENTRVVSYLVKEFEMRKAATDYKRVQIAKTGVLDTRKLAQYKIREDLFKSVTMTKDGKKHGMLFVLDWSGSMSDNLVETVKQLISLVTFCHRVGIPFQVFAFSDCALLKTRVRPNITEMDVNEMRRTAYNTLTAQSLRTPDISANFCMIELFSHKMTSSDLSKMCKTLFNMSYGFVHEYYELCGTPLNEALSFVYDYAEKFVRENQVEKFTLIKLSDGDGGRVTRYNDCGRSVYFTSTYDYEAGARYLNVRFLRCPVTKKIYSIDHNTNWGNLLSQMIKDRYNCGVIGFHVTMKRARDINYAMVTYGLPTSDIVVHDARREMLKEGFSGLTVYGHDELFLMRSDFEVVEEELSGNMTTMSASAIARQFTKHLQSRKTSRILLNRFVGVVA